MKKINIENVAAFVGLNARDLNETIEGRLTDEDLKLVLLYFVVKSRIFEKKILSTRSKMFLKAVIFDIEKMTRKIEIKQDWSKIWDKT